MRILIISHSHPSISKGGGEIAAFHLYSHLKKRSNTKVWFLGCDSRNRHPRTGASFVQPFGPDEFLYSPAAFDWFNFANRDPNFPQEFATLLRELNPDVIHFHHYIYFGVEAFQIVRQTLPHCRIILTLHEFLAICHNQGQMVTPEPAYRPCYESNPVSCHQCFPTKHSSGDFFLRQRYIQNFFDHIDHFISPSRILANRYIEWGLAETRISVIENLVSAASPVITERHVENSPLILGFFGQISRLKGIDILFDAAAILHERQNKTIFKIHGDDSGQPEAIQTCFRARLKSATPNISYQGSYTPDQTDTLMRQTDAIVVPSIWWENSPVVIQEAYRNNCPVLCSKLGGMEEKVVDGIDGFHFQASSADALSALVEDLSSGRKQLSALRYTMQKPPTPESIIAAHLSTYKTRIVRFARTEAA